MSFILSSTTQKALKNTFQPTSSKLKKIQGLFKDLHRNLRTLQEKWNSTTSPKIQGLFKTVRTLYYFKENLHCSYVQLENMKTMLKCVVL